MTLLLFLFGSPRVERDGAAVELDTRKAVALLAYLAITGQLHSRDALAALLWPDYDQSHARATLRRTLSALHKALGGAGLEAGREAIGLDPRAGWWVDVAEFERRLAECATHGHRSSDVCPACIAPLEQAVRLYRDDFLAGFSLRDSSEFDDWQFLQQQGLRRELAAALERLAQALSAQGEHERAIAYARRWLSLDRLHEPAHRRLMQLYAWAGQRSAALRQYRECVQVLERELGVAPLEETTRVYDAIKENRLPPGEQWESSAPASDTTAMPAGAASAAGAPGPAHGPDSLAAPTPQAALEKHAALSSFPLVGRAAEWAALVEAYASIGDDGPGGRVVALEGEAGIGKTRLAEELISLARARGACVVAARCYEGETDLAYGPIIAALRAALAVRGDDAWIEAIAPQWLSEAARLLPELATRRPGLPLAPSLDTPGARSRFFEGVRQVLLGICSGRQPGVLFFDDVHWADNASLDLLIYLARRLREHALMLLLAWRTEEVPADHPLRRVVADLQRLDASTMLTLSRLSPSSVQVLVQTLAQAGMPLPVDAAERLSRETEGLPLFLVEYLTALAQGALASEADGWSVPGGVRALLHSRLSAVSETGRQVLGAAAVIGRSFDFDVLRDVSGRGEDETVAALEELVGRGLVEEVRGGPSAGVLTYDFDHEKLRAQVYEETSLARRRLLHRRVAEALAARMRGRREPDTQPEQIAHHELLAGNEAAAAEHFQLAGARARALYAHAEALGHFGMALALGHPDAAGLHAAIGDLHTFLGEYSAALKSYETAAALCDPSALGGIEHRLGNVYARRGEWDLAESHLEAALEAYGDAGPAAERAGVYADWSLAAHHHGQTERALELAGHALELAEAAQDARALAQAHNILGILASSQGDLAEARGHLERSLALAEQLGDAGARMAALNNLALACGAGRETERALELAEAALGLAVAQGDRHREAALHNNLADLLHAAGRSHDALAHLRQAVSIYAEIGVEAGAVQPEIWKLSEW